MHLKPTLVFNAFTKVVATNAVNVDLTCEYLKIYEQENTAIYNSRDYFLCA